MFNYKIVFEKDGRVTSVCFYESENGEINSFVNEFAQKEMVEKTTTLWVCSEETPEYLLPFCYFEVHNEWRVLA